MKISEIMTASPACCSAESSLKDVARMMVENDCGQIPVIDEETKRPIGVVTDRDIVCRAVAAGRDPAGLKARDVMTTPVVTVSPDARIEDCCRILEEKQIRRAPVVDGEGRCCGIVALADIAQTVPEKLTGEVVRTVSKRGAGVRMS